ncbi:MAG: nitroreductase family protein [Acidimicrobiaceae bacterium]|nr:nitroreductase family protein [Acidimicrobiaceae bacterium]
MSPFAETSPGRVLQIDLYEVLRRRRMTRSFAPDELDSAVLERMLDAARRVPSAGFTQGVDLLVLTEKVSRARFWELSSTAEWRSGSSQAAGLLAAPAIVLPLADPDAYVARYREQDKAGSRLSGISEESWPLPYWQLDAAFAALAILLAAESEGVGALVFALHDHAPAVLDAFGVPKGRQSVGAIALGQRDGGDGASGSPTRRIRRPLEDVVHQEAW